MSQRPVVYFSLQTQFENLGDCIINELVIRELARHSRLKVIQRRAPTWLLDRLRALPEVEIYASKRQWFGDLLRRMAVRSPIVFAFKPGHYLSSSKAKSLAYSAALVAFCGLCRIQGGKVIRSGVSLDRFGALQTRLQSVLGRLHTSYGVRDQASLDYARSLGAVSAHYSPDMAFLLADAEATSGLIGSKLITAEVERPKLSLSFRKQGLMKESSHVEKLSEVISGSSAEHGLSPVVVEQVTFDRELAHELSTHLKCSVVRFEQTEESVRGIFANYAQSRVVVSNRLHSLLFGWTAGAIPIPLVENSPHSKIVELFKHLNLAELLHFSDDLKQFPDHLSHVLRDESELRRKIRKIFQDQRVILQEALANCFEPVSR